MNDNSFIPSLVELYYSIFTFAFAIRTSSSDERKDREIAPAVLL